jgi:lipooligosaccharide transport system permease protein
MSSIAVKKIKVRPPSLFSRLYSVWYRHFSVYTKYLISNGFPAFFEPLFFLTGIGLGLGKSIGLIDGTEYIVFLATGIIIPPSMFTASFECTFGTFIRLEFDKVYDGMLSASITAEDLLIGEMFFAGTKGLFFSSAVLTVISISPMAVFSPLIGFCTAFMFAALSLFITSFVNNINHFNFYFTGLLTPMFFFSGIVYPLSNLPEFMQYIAEIFPLTHVARLVRAFCFNSFNISLLLDVLYVIVFTLLFGFLAVKKLKKRLIS